MLEELKNKKLMTAMWVIGVESVIFYLGILLIAIYLLEEGLLLGIIIAISTIIFLISCCIALKFEVDAGYYECSKCHHKFVPSYGEALMAMHAGTTRHLKCPNCMKRSWSKKVLKK